jgi:hypothetical protein
VIPFVFPKACHVRRNRPGPFPTYQQYKPFLRDEFEKRCVYCRMPDTIKGHESYGTDHYRPKSLFPQFATTYSNLFYCCNPCNSRKGHYWPPKGRVRTHFIPNPCDHEVFKHLRFVEEHVEAKTVSGEVARDLLDLNDPEVVAFRRFILDTIKTYEGTRADIMQTLAELRGRKNPSTAPNVHLDNAIKALESDLVRVDAHLARLEGR